MPFFSLSSTKKLAQQASPGQITNEALHTLRTITEETATNLLIKARRTANHAGRKKITKADIEFAKNI